MLVCIGLKQGTDAELQTDLVLILVAVQRVVLSQLVFQQLQLVPATDAPSVVQC